MIEKTGIFIAGMFEDMLMKFRAIRPMLCQKKGDISTNKLIVIVLVLILLIVMFFLYRAWTPDPARVGKCLTDTARLGPFT